MAKVGNKYYKMTLNTHNKSDYVWQTVNNTSNKKNGLIRHETHTMLHFKLHVTPGNSNGYKTMNMSLMPIFVLYYYYYYYCLFRIYTYIVIILSSLHIIHVYMRDVV